VTLAGEQQDLLLPRIVPPCPKCLSVDFTSTMITQQATMALHVWLAALSIVTLGNALGYNCESKSTSSIAWTDYAQHRASCSPRRVGSTPIRVACWPMVLSQPPASPQRQLSHRSLSAKHTRPRYRLHRRLQHRLHQRLRHHLHRRFRYRYLQRRHLRHRYLRRRHPMPLRTTQRRARRAQRRACR